MPGYGDPLRNIDHNNEAIRRPLPKLQNIIEHLIVSLLESNEEDLQDSKRMIGMTSNKINFPSLLLEWIDPEIRALEGKEVSLMSLLRIKQRQSVQSSMFKGAGCYLDFVSDSRDGEYLRFYVGQSVELSGRVRNHIHHIMRRDVASLHYFIHALGQGFRKSNFIRLVRLPAMPEPFCTKFALTEEDYGLILNIEEMVMALAFGSLPAGIHNKFSANPIDATVAGIHLNVASPLDQGGYSISDDKRTQMRDLVMFSIEAEIRAWPSFRAKTMTRAPATPRLMPSNSVLAESFLKAAEHLCGGKVLAETRKYEEIDIRAYLDDHSRMIKHDSGIEVALKPPFGSLSNSLAIIYQTSYSNRVKSWADKGSNGSNGIPFGLEKAGFTASNALIWPLDFGASHSLQSNRIEEILSICSKLSDVSIRLVNASAVRVVIASGDDAQEFISRFATELKVTHTCEFTAADISIGFRVRIDGGQITQVILNAPDLQAVASQRRVGINVERQLSCIFRLASVIAGMTYINCRFYESGHTRGEVWQCIAMAKRGIAVNLNSLSSRVRAYLTSRGFREDEDVHELVQASGQSLGIAIHILYCVLSTIARRTPQKVPLAERQKPNMSFGGLYYTKESLEAVAKLWWKKVERDQAALKASTSAKDNSVLAKETDLSMIRMSLVSDLICSSQEKQRIESVFRGGLQEIADVHEVSQLEDLELAEGADCLNEIDGTLDESLSKLSSDMDFSPDKDRDLEYGPSFDLSVEVRNELLNEQLDELLINQPTKSNPETTGPSVVKSTMAIQDTIEEILRLRDTQVPFDEICKQFPGRNTNVIRRWMKRKKYNSSFTGSSSTLKGDHRIFETIRAGYNVHESNLNVGGAKLLWNLHDWHKENAIEQGYELRVWIDVTEDEKHPSAWYSDLSCPDLQRFAFRIGTPEDTFESSLPFTPILQGFSRSSKYSKDKTELEEQAALAKRIMSVHNKMQDCIGLAKDSGGKAVIYGKFCSMANRFQGTRATRVR
ncbi:MAG: hypothetical protein Q9222_006263 [Ikaeria aurantiellina]